ncbi:MAG: cytochrome c [Saprospiraceae bacterium]
MKRLLRLLMWLILIVVGLLVIAAAYIAIKGIPTYVAKDPGLKIEVTEARVVRGLKIAKSLCIECHKADNDISLSGKAVIDVPDEFGKIFSRNITNHPEIGIGKWTDGQIAYLLRTGVGRDGRYYPPYMPKFANMSDEDLASVIAFLRSDNPMVQASDSEPRAAEPSFLVKVLCNLMMKPLPYPDKAIIAPDTNDLLKYGRYIVAGAFVCYECHSADFKTNNQLMPEKSPGYLGGGNVMNGLEGKKVASANLTPDKATGIGSWTEAEFLTYLKTGQGKNGSMRYPMVPYSHLTDNELKAIYAYLQTVPAISNEVNRNVD